jgi:hypothetical protein
MKRTLCVKWHSASHTYRLLTNHGLQSLSIEVNGGKILKE